MFDLIPFDRRGNNVFDVFDRMWDDSFFGQGMHDIVPCRTDIIDKGDSYLMRADMPGFSKEDIHIDIQGDQLSITAEHKQEVSENKKNYIRHERRYGTLSRSFDIQGIDAGKIAAAYTNGVLELTLPKVQEAKPETKTVQIN